MYPMGPAYVEYNISCKQGQWRDERKIVSVMRGNRCTSRASAAGLKCGAASAG
jgi:hypothetical protein